MKEIEELWLSREALEALDRLTLSKGWHQIWRVNNTYYLDSERFFVDDYRSFFPGIIDEVKISRKLHGGA